MRLNWISCQSPLLADVVVRGSTHGLFDGRNSLVEPRARFGEPATDGHAGESRTVSNGSDLEYPYNI